MASGRGWTLPSTDKMSEYLTIDRVRAYVSGYCIDFTAGWST